MIVGRGCGRMEEKQTEAHIRLEKVWKKFDNGSVAVRDLTLDVFRGETLVLIGPSGCGKTTTLRLVNRLVEPTEGRIFFDGENTLGMNPDQLRQRMGYVIQGIGLFPHMSVEDNVAVVPRLKKLGRQAVRETVARCLDLVGLPIQEWGSKWPGELSGGQRQRVGVARALAGDPEVILMDEPFGALDPITREVLQDELLALKERLGKTILFVTHDIHEAMKMGSRVAIMKGGELVQAAEPLALLSCPADSFVSDFVGAENHLAMFSFVKVRDIGLRTENLPVVTEEATFAEALSLVEKTGGLLYGRRRFVYVLDRSGKVLGYVDLEGSRNPLDPVRHALKPAPTVAQESSVHDALLRMVENGVINLPVVDENRNMKGLLTFGDLNDLIENQRRGEGCPSKPE
jgi:osmoprotectant transport system ATP-binding protein